jgi:hypothetical protein
VIETAHFPTVQGQMQTPSTSSPEGRTSSMALGLVTESLFFVFLSAPSETATISPCQLG